MKNEHLGFEILYSYRGVIRKYRLDYIVRLTNGTMLILEVKGEKSNQSDAKHDFLAEWVEAVNSHGGFGQWAWAVSYDPADVWGILAKFGSDSPAASLSAQPRR